MRILPERENEAGSALLSTGIFNILIHTPLRGNVERRRYACAQGSHAPVEPFQRGGGSGELSSVFELRRRGLSTAAYIHVERERER